jgi:hypothetical protein
MTLDRGHLTFLIAFIIVGGILGSALGTFIASHVQVLAFIKTSLTGPIGFNLEIISFSLNLNIAAILGMILGIFLFFKV